MDNLYIRKKAVWLNSSDVKYNGEILYLTFKISDNAECGDTNVSVVYSPGDISDYGENDVNFKTESGKIVIGISQQAIQKLIEIIRRMLEIIKNIFQCSV